MMTDRCAGDSERSEDIVDAISEATGYFHDNKAAMLRDIAKESGQKPIGIVRGAVEDRIDDLEWKVAHFEDDGREYISQFAPEYYQIHRRSQVSLERSISELCEEDPVYGERSREEHEAAVEILRGRARVHEAKAEVAAEYLRENGTEPEEVWIDAR